MGRTLSLREQVTCVVLSSAVVLEPVEETSSEQTRWHRFRKHIRLLLLFLHVRTLVIPDPLMEHGVPGVERVRHVPASPTALASRVRLIERIDCDLVCLRKEIIVQPFCVSTCLSLEREVLKISLLVVPHEHGVVQVEVILRPQLDR